MKKSTVQGTAELAHHCDLGTEYEEEFVLVQYWNDSSTKDPNQLLVENILKQLVLAENLERGDEGVVFWIEAPVGIVEEDVGA